MEKASKTPAYEGLMVKRIQNGTVIDHILPGHGFKVVQMLGLDKFPDTIAILLNAKSDKLPTGRKDLIKVSNRVFTEEELNIIAVISPTATINVVENSQVIKKFGVKIPKKIIGFFKCPNNKCITNHEDHPAEFSIKNVNSEDMKNRSATTLHTVRVKCEFCERSFELDQLIIPVITQEEV